MMMILPAVVFRIPHIHALRFQMCLSVRIYILANAKCKLISFMAFMMKDKPYFWFW